MKLRKSLLISTLLLSISACSDNAPTGEKQADEIEARYRDYISKSNDHLNINKSLNLNKISYQLTNYQKGTDTSIGESQIIIEDHENNALIFNVRDEIKHDANLAKQGIIGEVNSTLSIAPESQNAYELEDVFEHINPYLTIKTTFKTKDEVQAIIALSPIKENHFEYGGFNYQSNFNQKEYASYLYPQKITIKSEKLLSNDDQGFHLSLSPFAIDGSFDGKNGEFTSTPIKLQITENNENYGLDIGKALFKLKDLKLDNNGLVLGEKEFEIKELNIKNSNEIYEFQELLISQKQEQTANKYNFLTHLHLDIKTNFVQKIFGIDNFHISKLQFDFKLLDISKENFTQLIKTLSVEEDYEILFNNFINETIDILKNGASIESKLTVKTTQGDISGSYNLKLQNGKNISEEEKAIIINALKNSDDQLFSSMILSKLEINMNLTMPLSAINALGLDVFLAIYGNNYIEIKGDQAVVDILIKDNKIHYKSGVIDLNDALNSL